MVELRQAHGDLDGALELLDEAERVYVSDLAPNVRPIPALRARMWLTQGRVPKALAWAREQSLSVHDELSYLHEFEHVTLARILIARYQLQPAEQSLPEAVALLGRLVGAAESGGRVGGPDWNSDRDSGAAGHGTAALRRHPCRLDVSGSGAQAGRTGGICARVR